MTVFWIVAVALAAVALCFVLPPLLRRDARPAEERSGGNLAVLREQRAQLDAEFAAGRATAEQHAQGVAEIERRLLEEDDGAAAAPRAAAQGRALGTAVLLGLGLPLVAVGLYARLGQPEALSAPSAAAVAADAAASAAEVQALVDALAQRMAGEPDNAEGWLLLARSFAATERFKEASDAYARVVKLLPPDAQLLADYADVLAVAQGRTAVGEPTRLIEQALQLDPDNLKALAMAGHAAFDRGDFAVAARHWERAGALAPAGGAFAQAMAKGAEEARAAAGSTAANAAAPATPVAAAAGPQIAGRVRMAPALAAQVAPTDTVFVFARAAEGPRMPLAIRRYPASALPLEFTLDDSTAMSPELRLSKFSRVVVGARVSKSGNATPQPGDLLTQSEPLPLGQRDLELVIDRVQP